MGTQMCEDEPSEVPNLLLMRPWIRFIHWKIWILVILGNNRKVLAGTAAALPPLPRDAVGNLLPLSPFPPNTAIFIPKIQQYFKVGFEDFKAGF